MNEDTKWLRDEYAMEAFKFFLEKYFDTSFEEFANDCELEVSELIASLSYLMADRMINAR